MKTLEVEVTPEDIANGVPEDACRCPIALAVQRQEQCAAVTVGQGTIWILRSVKDQTVPFTDTYQLPVEGNRFIRWFDVKIVGKYLVKPVKFTATQNEDWGVV